MRNFSITNRETISNIVEAPLIQACEILYDKNIKTLESDNLGITLDYESLSKINKQIAHKYFGGHGQSGEGIKITSISAILSENASDQEIEERYIRLANVFEKQPLSWTAIKTVKELAKEIFFIDDISKSNHSPKDLAKTAGWYYDEETHLCFASKEHYEKLKEFKESFLEKITETMMEFDIK